MSEWDRDRLISASEVERWCYCPLSWLLERMDSHEDKGLLSSGTKNHELIGSQLATIQRNELRTRDTRKIVIAFLSFAVLLVTMSLLLFLLTNVGFFKEVVWRTALIVTSIVLLIVSTTVYIFSSNQSGRTPKEKYQPECVR
jgi:hypothetical protein